MTLLDSTSPSKSVALTTIKVSKKTRDRLKEHASRHNLTLEEHLNFLEDLAERELRWDSMRTALAQMSAGDWAEYRKETTGFAQADLDELNDESW